MDSGVGELRVMKFVLNAPKLANKFVELLLKSYFHLFSTRPILPWTWMILYIILF